MGDIPDSRGPEKHLAGNPFLCDDFRERGRVAQDPMPENGGGNVHQVAKNSHADAEMTEQCDGIQGIVFAPPDGTVFDQSVPGEKRVDARCGFRPDFRNVAPFIERAFCPG